MLMTNRLFSSGYSLETRREICCGKEIIDSSYPEQGDVLAGILLYFTDSYDAAENIGQITFLLNNPIRAH